LSSARTTISAASIFDGTALNETVNVPRSRSALSSLDAP